jgi:chloramphenicol 3-O-phosphotransferase
MLPAANGRGFLLFRITSTAQTARKADAQSPTRGFARRAATRRSGRKSGWCKGFERKAQAPGKADAQSPARGFARRAATRRSGRKSGWCKGFERKAQAPGKADA